MQTHKFKNQLKHQEKQVQIKAVDAKVSVNQRQTIVGRNVYESWEL